MQNMIEFKRPPDWSEIEHGRRECDLFLESLGMNEETKDAVRMITSELIANAIQFGDFSGETTNFTCKIEHGARGILIQAWNPIPLEGMAAHLMHLDSIVQWIRGFQSPVQAYLERLKIVASQPSESESLIGLVRIAYEGQAVLDFYIDESDLLQVSAFYARGERCADRL